MYEQYNNSFCCTVTFILLPVCLIASLKSVMFARATFLQQKTVSAVESRPFGLMSDTGPVWRSKVYFWTFSASCVNFVCLISLVALPVCEQRLVSVCFPRYLCKFTMSYYTFSGSVLLGWSTVMKCDTSYLVVILIIYTHLCWIRKLGCALLRNKYFILSEQNWIIWEWCGNSVRPMWIKQRIKHFLLFIVLLF